MVSIDGIRFTGQSFLLGKVWNIPNHGIVLILLILFFYTINYKISFEFTSKSFFVPILFEVNSSNRYLL